MDPQVHQKFVLGRYYYRAGRMSTALPLLREVALAHDEFADVHNMLGVIEFQLGRSREAARHFERALELNPAYAEAALPLSICYDQEGRYEEARTVYTKAVRAGGEPEAAALSELDEMARAKIANLHGELGDVYLALGFPTRAVREYQSAVESAPGLPDMRLKLATTLRDVGRLPHALKELGRLREENPEYLPARLQLGVTLWSANELAQARAEWDFVLARDPDNAMAKFYIAAFETHERSR